jgi:L-threonylcarbamoyladenylate synthase
MRVNLKEAIALLQQGEVVAIPTETVYGLAADATNDTALLKIYSVKQRPANNPLIVHISDINQVETWAATFSPLAKKLAEAFWPGPFTLVLPAKDSVSTIVRAGEPTVALRVPSHPLALQLLKTSGLGLAAPSANKYTQLSPTTVAHVAIGLGEEIAVLDGGACQVGIESTIVSVEDDEWRLLRHGMIDEVHIEAVAGKAALKDSQPVPKAPGQHLLHYSPRTPLLLFSDKEQLLDACAVLWEAKRTHAVLFIGAGDRVPTKCWIHCLTPEPAKAAEELYRVLHQMDEEKVEQLLIELPPDTPEWAAVRDRLTRAGYQLPD